MNEWTMADEWLGLDPTELRNQVSESEKKREVLIARVKELEFDAMSIMFVSEDFESESEYDVSDLQRAFDMARNSDLERFLKHGVIPYEDGYLRVAR